jgi:hypothetical protein
MTRYLPLLVRILVAGILLQTLFFKFTAAPESVHIFTALGAEPWGRIGSGIAELGAAALLLARSPRLVAIGAVATLGIIGGAIGAHLFVLGIEVAGDGGTLFGLALVVFAGALFTAWRLRGNLPNLLPTRPSRGTA